jgi:Lar family restriction alleviation protein
MSGRKWERKAKMPTKPRYWTDEEDAKASEWAEGPSVRGSERAMSKRRRPWTPEEDAKILAWTGRVTDLAKELDRPYGSTAAHRHWLLAQRERREAEEAYEASLPKRDPCPFCGGTDIGLMDCGDNIAFAQCEDCGATGPSGESEEAAAEAWNRRKADAQE